MAMYIDRLSISSNDCNNVFFNNSPLPINGYSPEVYSCWMDFGGEGTRKTLLVKLFLYYIPLWIVFIISIVLVIKIFYYIKKVEEITSEKIQNTRILLYPLVLFLCGLWPTVDRIY